MDTRGYEAFGTKNVEAGSEALAYGFAGEPLDSTTKLAYHRARWMDSRVGRFTGMDAKYGCPDHRCGGYEYTNNNPANEVDPTGFDGMDAEQTSFFNLVGVSVRGVSAYYANLRSRPADGSKYFNHLYVEYAEDFSQTQAPAPAGYTRYVFEAKPDYTEKPGVGMYGYLYGLTPRVWGTVVSDPGAPKIKPEALENDSDSASPFFLGVTQSTYQCLKSQRNNINARHISYDLKTANSNTWAVSVCKACGISWESLPGDGFLVGTWWSL